MTAPDQTADDRSAFVDEKLVQRLLAIDLAHLDVDQAQNRAAEALVYPLAVAMLLGAALAGALLTTLGLDVTRLYASALYAPLRVILHNALAVFFLSFPLVLVALKSRCGAVLRRRLLAHRTSAIEAQARTYLRSVEGEEGLLWRFEDVLGEALAEGPHSPPVGQEAIRQLIRASRGGELKAVDLMAYRGTVQLLKRQLCL